MKLSEAKSAGKQFDVNNNISNAPKKKELKSLGLLLPMNDSKLQIFLQRL